MEPFITYSLIHFNECTYSDSKEWNFCPYCFPNEYLISVKYILENRISSVVNHDAYCYYLKYVLRKIIIVRSGCSLSSIGPTTPPLSSDGCSVSTKSIKGRKKEGENDICK